MISPSRTPQARAKRRRKNIERFLLRGAERRAKEKGLLIDLELSDIEIPKRCPVLGIKLKPGKWKSRDSSPTLDRIDNRFGYTKDNTMVISWRANKLKGDATLGELIMMANFYKEWIK